MKHLQPLQIDENTVIYIEADEDVALPLASPAVPEPPTQPVEQTREQTRRDLGLADKGLSDMAKGTIEQVQRTLTPIDPQKAAIQSMVALEATIRTYTSHTLKAFKNVAEANIDKVTMEFGINVGGEAGVPYVTKGTAECSLKITVECSFPSTPPASHP
ncbi:CU044_2847 family protein [Trichothermofontia sp.]